jgi:hypothetical protein
MTADISGEAASTVNSAERTCAEAGATAANEMTARIIERRIICSP